jgi:Na+/proline symporter
MMVQRYLCARNRSAASWALGISGFVVFLQFAFFLLLGMALACFFSRYSPPTPIEKGDHALVTFVVHFTSTGLRGVVLAAIFSASMSSSLNSVTNSLMNDWLQSYLNKLSDRKGLLIARALTIVFAVVQAAVAMIAVRFEQSIVDSVLAIAGFSTGLILGLYGLGLIAPKASQRTALMAFVAGTIVTCYAAFGTNLHWSWYTLVGSGAIVLVGIAMSRFDDVAQSP